MFPPHPSKTPILPETTDEQDITLGMQDRKPLLSGSAALGAGWAAVQAGNEKSATEREEFRVENDPPGKDISGLCGDSGRPAQGEIVSLAIDIVSLLTLILRIETSEGGVRSVPKQSDRSHSQDGPR